MDADTDHMGNGINRSSTAKRTIFEATWSVDTNPQSSTGCPPRRSSCSGWMKLERARI